MTQTAAGQTHWREARLRYVRGIRLLASGATDRARAVLSAGEAADPWTLCLEAEILRASGTLAQAIHAARRAVALLPDAAEPAFVLAAALADARHRDEALAIVTRLNADHPAHVPAWLRRIALHTSRAELDAAVAAADAGLACRQDDRIVFARAHVLFLAHRYLDAAATLRRLTPASRDRGVWHLLGRSLALAFRDAEALEAYTEVLRIVEHAPTTPSRLLRMTSPHFDPEQRLRDCTFLAERGDHLRPVIEALGGASFYAGRIAEARDWWERAVASGANAEIRYRLGVALYLNGELERATSVLRASIDARSTDSRPAFVLASALTRLGATADADAVLRRVLTNQLSSFHAVAPPPGGSDADETVLLPWNLRSYVLYGLVHPLLDQYCRAPYDGLKLTYSTVPESDEVALEQARAAVLDFEATRQYLHERCPQVTAGRVFEFLESRHFLSQLLLQDAALTVSHTSPFNFLGRPWTVHVENPVTFLHPFLTYGRLAHTTPKDVPAYWLLKAYFEHESCRGIFSHIPESCDAIGRLFESDAIARKVTYVPLGLVPSTSAPAVGTRGDRCRILFTSSFNQQDSSFYSRGGLYVLSSFFELAEEFPNLELVLRASIPGDLPPELARRLYNHPRITILSRRVSEAELAELFASADIFPLISYTIHCLSLLRAMANGSACVVSDAPDYDGFVEDGRTAVVVHGRRGRTYDRDPNTLMIRDDFPMLQAFDAGYAERVTSALRTLVADPAARAALGENARAHVESRHGLAAAREAFGAMLRESIDGYARRVTPAA